MQHRPLTCDEQELAGKIADLIKEARELAPRVSALEASELSRVLEQASGLLNAVLAGSTRGDAAE